jgi:type IV pilus assembly protein PilN
MVRINLLPWRASVQARRRRQFIRLLFVGIVITTLILGSMYWQNARLLTTQTRDNVVLREQIAQLATPLEQVRHVLKKREALLAYQQSVQALQIRRVQNVRLLDELIKTLPDAVYLEEVVQQDNQIKIQGQATTNTDISHYLRQLATSPWLQNPQLEVIEQSNAAEKNDTQQFRLTLQQVYVPALETAP